jgi:hypothetical protein
LLQALPFHSSWFGHLEQYLVRSSDHKTPHYADSFICPLLPHLSYAYKLSSAPYSQTPPTYVLPRCERPCFTFI